MKLENAEDATISRIAKLWNARIARIDKLARRMVRKMNPVECFCPFCQEMMQVDEHGTMHNCKYKGDPISFRLSEDGYHVHFMGRILAARLA